jgi:ERCC4-type nuclease
LWKGDCDLIFIDSNEEVTTTIPKRLANIGLPTMVVHQGFDYVINNMVGVERKEASDYIQSLLSGHLQKQQYEYSHNFELSYIAIIGDVEEYLISHNLQRKMYMSSLVGSSLKYAPDGKQGQIVTVNLKTDYDFLLFLQVLHEKVVEGNFTRLPKFERAKMKNDDYVIKILTSFPNIGEKRAEEILKIHRSLQNAFSTLIYQPDQFQVKGLTIESIKQMHEILVKEKGENDADSS